MSFPLDYGLLKRIQKLISQIPEGFLGYNPLVMNLKELTQQMNDLVRHHGWYEPDSPKQQTARNLAISLSLEASEVLEHFQWTDETKDAEGLRGELADVALYLLQLASVEKIDLEKAILDKIEQNWDRKWPEESDLS